jgi:kynurenine formamidase
VTDISQPAAGTAAAGDGLPSYDELQRRVDAPPGTTWGLFGETSDLGTLNLLTAERVLAAKELAREGRAISLDLGLSDIQIPPSHQRSGLDHVLFGNGVCHRDDHLHLYTQAATHFDGFGHMRHHHHGFYNGAPDESVVSGERLGIDHIARRGIIGRAVLVDIPRFLDAVGRPQLDHREGEPFGIDLVEQVLEHQGVQRLPGDIILLRTGWLDHYFNTLSAEERRAMPGRLRSPGLIQAHETLAWLWDTRVSVIVSDNAGVECFPPVPTSPFNRDMPADAGIPPGLMHPTLIAIMGFVIGELWWLDELASDCALDGVYESLFVAKPLNLRGGVGSPANALAIK